MKYEIIYEISEKTIFEIRRRTHTEGGGAAWWGSEGRPLGRFETRKDAERAVRALESDDLNRLEGS